MIPVNTRENSELMTVDSDYQIENSGPLFSVSAESLCANFCAQGKSTHASLSDDSKVEVMTCRCQTIFLGQLP